jgi:hypothetical protein
MNLNLPRPYPDELMYSVFARHFAYTQPNSVAFAYKTIDGHAWFSTRYVRGASRLAEKTHLTWGLSGLQIIDRHTLLPFNGAFLKPEVHLKCTECFLNNNPHGGATALGMGNSSVVEPRFLRFCASCLHEDIQAYGETYWRRQHQLCGTLFCIRHEEPLRDSTAPMSPIDKDTLDATAHCRAHAESSGLLSPSETPVARAIAERSASILNGTLGPWLNPDTGAQYQEAAVEIGYGIGVKLLDTKRFGRDLIEFFGPPLLETLGCRLTERSVPLRQIFYKTGTNHPLIHVLVQLYLESQQRASRSTLKRRAVDPSFRQEWKCPNVYARHDENFRIPDIYLRVTKKGERYFHGRCLCGFVFAFKKAREDDPTMPLVSRATGYGEAIEIEIRRLFDQLGSINKVCLEMNLHWRVVRRTLDGVRNAFELSPEKIALLRRTWLETQGSDKHSGTYQALVKYDRAWLRTRKRRRGQGSQQVSAPNRDEDDIIYASRIESAAASLRSKGSKVTVLGLGRILGGRINLKGLSRSPRTIEMLRKVLDGPNSVLERERERITGLNAA